MDYQEHDIVKLYNEVDQNYMYVAIQKSKDKLHQVAVLKQPPHTLTTNRYADRIFKQHVHEDDEVDCIELKFNNTDNTFFVHENMCEKLKREELVDLLIHLIHIHYGATRFEEMVLTTGLRELKTG